jgi:hypothetical protein
LNSFAAHIVHRRLATGPPTSVVVRLSKTPVITSVIKMPPHKTIQKVIILKSDEWSHATRFDNFFMITQLPLDKSVKVDQKSSLVATILSRKASATLWPQFHLD